MNTPYVPPTLIELGDFDQLTQCLNDGNCNDFLGCGRAIICIG